VLGKDRFKDDVEKMYDRKVGLQKKRAKNKAIFLDLSFHPDPKYQMGLSNFIFRLSELIATVSLDLRS
jgi:hypothetical protein